MNICIWVCVCVHLCVCVCVCVCVFVNVIMYSDVEHFPTIVCVPPYCDPSQCIIHNTNLLTHNYNAGRRVAWIHRAHCKHCLCCLRHTRGSHPGTQFTCFTGTKVQILTQKALAGLEVYGYFSECSSASFYLLLLRRFAYYAAVLD